MATKTKKTSIKKTQTKKVSDAKKIITFFVAGLVILSLLSGETTFLQVLPFGIFGILAYQDLWKKTDRKELIIALALVMAVLNFFLAFEEAMAFIDMIVWTVISYIFWKH